MARRCRAAHGTDCVNLAQGFPDFAAPAALKAAAVDAIQEDFNQYAITWGSKGMRDAIAAKTSHFRGLAIDPETEITVCCGVTQAMLSSILALVDPGDVVIIFEPFYEHSGPDCILSGATPVWVPPALPAGGSDPDHPAVPAMAGKAGGPAALTIRDVRLDMLVASASATTTTSRW